MLMFIDIYMYKCVEASYVQMLTAIGTMYTNIQYLDALCTSLITIQEVTCHCIPK